MPDFGRLRSYDRFSFPHTNSCEVGLPYGLSLISMRGLAKGSASASAKASE
jgi:hypothetical protein